MLLCCSRVRILEAQLHLSPCIRNETPIPVLVNLFRPKIAMSQSDAAFPAAQTKYHIRW